jgi:hypothetical protein
VQSLAEEHANALLGTLSDLTWLERCAAQRLDPQTGDVPRGKLARQRLERIPTEAERFRQSYQDLLAVYEDAFGETAALDLDQYVRSRLQAEPQARQRRLF